MPASSKISVWSTDNPASGVQENRRSPGLNLRFCRTHGIPIFAQLMIGLQ